MIQFILIIAGIFFLVFMLLALYAGFSTPKYDEQYKNLNNILSKIPYTKKFKSTQDKNIITFNEEDKSIYIVKKDNDNCIVDRINHEDILQVEIVQDEESITQSSRGSQLAGTIVGSLALGGTGAVIGGLSGKKNHHTKVSNIGLQFVVNDTSNPVRIILFYEYLLPIKTNEDKYKDSYSNVNEWFKLVEVLIHQADKNDKKEMAN